MRKGQVVTKVIEGQKKEVKYIGKGRFTTAYAENEIVYLFCKGDWVKEALCLFAQNESHVPKLERLEYTDTYSLYKSILYQPLTAKCEAWAMFRLLEKEWKNAWDYFCQMYGWNWLHDNQREAFKLCEHFLAEIEHKVSADLYESLERVYVACTTYGSDFLFEFTSKNLAVDDNGKLILLDPAFFISQNRRKNDR